MNLKSIHHMALNAADYDRTKDFYVNKLGFGVLGEYVFPSGTRRMDCALGSCRLEIFHSEKNQPRPREPMQGYRHLCFRVEDIHAAVAELEKQGIYTDGIRPDPMASGLLTFFYDPDGLELELYQDIPE